MALERIQKILARAGIASRRKAEELIVEGSVTVNGKVAQIGEKADFSRDAIKVNGKLLKGAESRLYIAFHKPKNVISSLSDPEGRPSIGDYLSAVQGRVYPIGRLDFTSDGLILLTNDGEIADQIQRASGIARVYHVKIKGHPDSEMVRRIERGARIDHRLIRPDQVRLKREFTNKALIEVVFMGSGAVDVKALFEAKGFLVERITRVAIGHLSLSGMDPGSLKYLRKSQVEALLTQPELGVRKLEQETRKESLLPHDLREPRQFEREREREAAAEGRPAPKPKISVRPAARRPIRITLSPKRRRPGGEDRPSAGRQPYAGKKPPSRGRRSPR